MASPPLVGRNTARANIGALIRCEDSQPPDINLYMLLGANYQIVEEWDRAVAAYESALRIDRRPEIYLSLGTCHLETGEEQKAIDAFVAACAFAPAMIEEVPAAIREQVTGRIEEEYGRDWLR
jgi:tetratricopeptide (TPR) repeat protein